MAVQESRELGRDPRFLAALQLEQHVFLGGEVEEEGSVRDACGGDDRVHIGAGHPATLELGDRRAQDPFPRL